MPIEYVMYEKMTSLMMAPGTFDWLDIGSFDDVHEVTPKTNRLIVQSAAVTYQRRGIGDSQGFELKGERRREAVKNESFNS